MPKGFSDGLFSCCASFAEVWHDMTFSGRISQIFGFVPACVSRIQQMGWSSLYAYSKPFATFYDKKA